MVFIFQALGQRIHKAEYSEMMKTEPGYARCPLRTCPVPKKAGPTLSVYYCTI